MLAKLTVVLETGATYEGEVNLTARTQTKKPLKRSSSGEARTASLDFSMNERSFARRFASGLSGPEKFALLVAYLAKGKQENQVLLREVEKLWNRMKSILSGRFNRKYSNKAKEYGWVNSPKQGTYVLLPGWTEVLSRGGVKS